MRTFSTAVQGELAKKFGLSVKVFVGVKWSDDKEYFYSTEEFSGAKKAVVSLTGLQTTKIITGSGATQNVTITLSDTDGEIKQILDTVDIHKRPVNLYMGFDGVPIDQAVTLIEGEVNSEMVWSDKARTLTFTVLSKIEGRQFGFAMEDGLFHKVDARDRATPWPFRFGDTCAYPAVKVQNGIVGILREGQGVLDATIDAKICQAKQINCPLIKDPNATTPEVDGGTNVTNATTSARAAIANDPFSFNGQEQFGSRLARPVNELGQSASTGRVDPDDGIALIRDRECERGRFETLCQLLRHRANQLVYVRDQLSILGGEEFPQNQLITIRVDDVVYTGIMTFETFSIVTTNRLDQPSANVDCTNIDGPSVGYRKTNEQTPGSLAECEEPTNTYELRIVGGAGDAWRALDGIADSQFKWLPAGTKVYLEQSSTEVHVASLVPGTVTGVYAYRTLGDTNQLTELPTDYYSVVTTDYGDLEAVEIWLTRPLSSYPDENWKERIYVAFDSDVGPNPVDVIEWIVERYTDFTVDSANFATVKSYLTNYPCNYYHATKENVLATLNQIAREARCALVITDNVVRLVYLPREPSADKTFTEADLVNGTFGFKHTRTEELITSSTVEWQPWDAPQLDNDIAERRFTVQNNVNKYGFFDRTEVYRTINNEEQALKTATFWSIRESNTWRTVQFQTTLEHMDLELFDTIELNIGQFPTINCVITSMTIDPTQGTIAFEAWTPILSGTTEKYFFAWPQSIANVPYPNDSFDVELPPIQVTPPVDHPLYIADPNQPLPPTTGDRFPADSDDTFPPTVCQDVTEPELIDAIEPIFEEIDFPTDVGQQAERADEVTGNNLSYNFEEPDDGEACGRPTFDACVWEVTVGYATCCKVAPGTGSGFNCDIKPGPCSSSERGASCCFQGFYDWCKTFGSELIANAYVGVMKAQIEAQFCQWRTGNTGPVYTIGPIKRQQGTGPCVGMGNTEVSSGAFDPNGILS